MDSKEEMTLSQKIVTDAVLKMDDYKKMKWLTRRYGKGKALDKAFDKVFSSLKKTHIFEISQRIKLLQDLNASHDRISNEIEDLIENVTQDKIDFSPVCIIDIINTIKDNQLKFELIEFYSSESEGSHYDCEAWHESFDRSVIITLEESNNLKSILSLLSLRTTNYEIIKAIGNKLSSIELTPEVIQTIANMPKIEIEEKQLRILHNELLRDNKMSKATLILFNVIKEEQKIKLLNNNLFIIPNIETELEKPNVKEKEALKSLYKTLTPFLLPKNAPEKLAYKYYGNRYSGGILDFTTVIEYKDFLKDVDLRPALFWYKTLDNFKNQDEMFEYFDMLKTYRDSNNPSYYSGLGFYSSNDFNLKEAISNKCCESIKKYCYTPLIKENCPQSFVEEHKELFLPEDIPSDLKQMIHDGKKIPIPYIIVNHPEWVKYFKNIDLNLVGKFFDNSNELIDSNSVLTEFNSREDALLCVSYFTEIGRYYATKVISQNNIKQRMFDTIYSQIINVCNPIGEYQAGYAFALPEEFKKKYSELFLPENAPDELKNKVYHYKLEPKDIVEHPEWIHYLSKINLNIIIPNYDKTETHTSEVDSFKNQEETIKYISMLNYIRGSKDRFYYYSSINVKNEFIKSIKNTMTNYEYYTTIFTPNIFFDSSVIDAIKENNLDRSFGYLRFRCQDMSYLNPEEVAKYFELREDAIKCCMMYKYIQYIQYEQYRQYNKFNSNLNTDNIKESLFSVIHKAICVGILPHNEDMPEDFKKEFPDLFLSADAPEELKQLIYNRNLEGKNLLDHPEWIDVLTKENINLNVLFNLKDVNYEHIDVNILAERFDSREDAIKTFAMYKVFCKNNNGNDIDIENPKESIYPIIYEEILEGSRYFEDMPEDFKKEHPELFLDKTIPEDIRTKFYQKEFTLKDFEENPNLIKTFGNTNLLFGLKDSQYCFMGTLFKGHDANNDYLKAIEVFNESTNKEEAEFIRNSIKKSNMRAISIDKFPDLIELHKNVQYSNSIELSSFKDNYMPEILNSDNPIATFKLLEDIFLKNSLPGYAKLFKCFKTIYPTFEKPGSFNFTPGSRISPELLEAGNADHRFLIVYNDLLRIAIHSQDSSLVEYLDNIDKGSELYFALCKKEKTIETISNEEAEELTTFASHLESIYEGISFSYQDELKGLTLEQNNSVKKFKLLDRMSAKDYFKDRNDLVQIDELEKYKRAMLKTKISILSKKFNASTIESADNLKDKIVSYIGHSAGYDSFNQMVEDINKIRNETDKRNRECAEEYRNKPFMFEEGDFLRGIGGIKALTGSINRGNVSKEFMCSYAGTSGSDTTPLDVDISYISPKNGITTSIDGTPTGWGFGNVFVVIKKNNPNLNITRDITNNPLETNYVPDKVEMFQTGYESHWGARTGITFTDIDFILYKETKIIERNADGLPQVDENGDIVYVKDSIQIPDDEWVPIVHDALAEIQFEIARNGYYIPVFDMLGRLSFTPEQYDELRSKMCGLPHYTSEEYHISNKLDFPGIDELIEIKKADMKKTAVREKLIREKIKEIMKTSKLKVDTIAVTDTLSTDLTEGIVQLIGTGSTSRGTNVPDDSDFDYMLKVDKKVVQTGMDELISSLKNIKHDEDNSHDNRVKLVGVTIDGLDIKIDTDISIAQKQNDIIYSTEMALEERLETIRKQSQSAYEKVIANIVYAKQFLKEIGTYKHARVDKTSGGLGGVGVENWILQNGGSFRQACETFMDKAIDHETGQIVPFEKFRKTYTIWDFGENHESKGQHPFDEYVSLNMNEAGYTKLCVELPKKLKEINEGLSRMSEINSNTPVEIEPEIESKVEIETEEELEPMTASYGFGR